MKVNILADDNGVGLTRSTRIIRRTLSCAGFSVQVHNPNDVPSASESHDLNLFLERLNPSWFRTANKNFLIPNQEWFLDEYMPYLGAVDCVLCKTRHAQNIFNALGCCTVFIGFTSEDRFDERYVHNYNVFFHSAGRSLQKGTKVIIRVWERHPQWPELLLIQHPETPQYITADNIHYLSAYLDDETHRRYQNEYSIHLCPSEAEGFGHYIVEAMSAQALVLTTDGPPMNELVTSERGILVPYRSTAPQRLGMNYYVDPLALEVAIEEVLHMDDAKKLSLARQARRWYEENDRFFRQRFIDVIKNV